MFLYDIEGKRRQVPVIAIIVAIVVTAVFIVLHIMNTETMTGLLEKNALLNTIFSMFNNSNILYGLLHLWLTVTLIRFLNEELGHIIFSIIFLIVCIFVWLLSLTGMYGSLLPQSMYQSVVLIMTGFFYALYPKRQAKVFYFFFPTEFAYGTFSLPSWILFLPFYILCQAFFTFWGFAPAFEWMFPSDSSYICTLLCPVIGACLGGAFYLINRRFHLTRQLFETSSKELNIDKTVMKGIDAYNNNNFKTAVDILKPVYDITFNQNLLTFLFNAYMNMDMEKEAIGLVEHTVKKLNAEEKANDLFNVFLEIRHTQIHKKLSPDVLIIFIRHLYRHNFYEETREYMDIIKKQHSDSYAYKKMEIFSKENDFY